MSARKKTRRRREAEISKGGPKTARETPENPGVTWTDALQRHQQHLRALRKAKGTVTGYRFELERLREHLLGEGVTTPAEIELSHLRDYQAGLLTGTASRSGNPNGVATVHRITTTLGGFFRFLVEEGLLESDPSLRLERPRLPKPLPGEILSDKEIRRLFAAPDLTKPRGLRDRALIEIFYGAGLRRSEALRLDLGDLDHSARELRVRHGKGDKGQVVPLTRAAWREVMSYLREGRPALASDHRDSARAVLLSIHGRRLSEATVLRSLRRYAAKARIPRLTPHVLRRTFATALLCANVSLRHIQLLLGHENLSTTAIYLRIDTRELREEILLKHPRERFDV